MVSVSVIIPVFNVAKYIERCARTLFSQTLKNMEFIFVNDCSTDNSIDVLREVIEDYPQRKDYIKIFSLEVNSGPSAARNYGIEKAQGEYIAFCDSDDWVDTTIYETLYQEAVKSSTDMVFCDFYMAYSDKNEYYNVWGCTSSTKSGLVREFMASKWTVLWNMIAKRSLFEMNNLRLPLDITYCEDFYLMVKLLYYSASVKKINQALYYYNQCNVSSIMQNCHNWLGVDDMNCYLKIIDFFKSENCLDDYVKEMSWRILNAFHEDMFDQTKHKEIVKRFPTSHKYILSSPFYNSKQKILMWLITHHCRILAVLILDFRNVVNKYRY